MPCIYTCGPDQALVKSGLCLGKPKIIPGGCVVAMPFIHKVQRLGLSIMTIEVVSPCVYTSLGVPVSVSSIAQVKISRYTASLENAASQLLGLPRRRIESITRQTLEGHQRAIMGSMSVEEITHDRKMFAAKVREIASPDLGNLGMEIVSYTIRGISDENGYMGCRGRQRVALVKRDARIGIAEAERDAAVQEAAANQAKLKFQHQSETIVADSKRRYDLKIAAFEQLVHAKKAESRLAYDLQVAKTRQDIKSEEMQIAWIERKNLIAIEAEEVKRTEAMLESSVKMPAKAERYKLTTLAEGHKRRVVLEAEAKARCSKMVGLAEAHVIEWKGAAQAHEMTSKSDAWKELTTSAYMDMIIERLPEIAHNISKPLRKTKKILVLNSAPVPELVASKQGNWV